MRWEYSQPEPQLIVTSGQEVYVYEEEANQVMVLPRDQLLSRASCRRPTRRQVDAEAYPKESGTTGMHHMDYRRF